MKKETLINLLNNQQLLTKKTTRKDIIALVRDMVEKHIKDNAEIVGISATRDNNGVNLGEVMEIVAKSLFRNKLAKSEKNYDATIQGEKVEIKFSTSDAYAHPINDNAKVDYYLIITYSKKLGGLVYKVPFANKNEIDINNQLRVTTNQSKKFIDNELTARLFN